MDMDNSGVVAGAGDGGIKRLNGNGKNIIKNILNEMLEGN